MDVFIFGGRGDLAARKLYPALFHLDAAGLLEDDVKIYAVARRDSGREELIEDTKPRVRRYVDDLQWSESLWSQHAQRIDYLQVDFSQPEQYQKIAEVLSEDRQALFYLATPPSLFAPICTHLGAAGCLGGDRRLMLEKPIGQDLASCRAVN
ncbi:MAG: glucose-6-phosphate dehydrogenase, partial [Pseudomonadota bacterium]